MPSFLPSSRRAAALTGLTAAIALAAASAHAVPVLITNTNKVATVDSKLTGPLAGVSPGDTISFSFMVDSEVYTDAPKQPQSPDRVTVRGYHVDPASLRLSIGGVDLSFDAATTTLYFNLRLNDPKAEGFYMGQGSLLINKPMAVHAPGMADGLGFSFLRTYLSSAQPWNSLNILDVQGAWDASDLSTYQWDLQYAGGRIAVNATGPGVTTIAAVPEPTTWMGLLLGAPLVLGVVRRRKAQR